MSSLDELVFSLLPEAPRAGIDGNGDGRGEWLQGDIPNVSIAGHDLRCL